MSRNFGLTTSASGSYLNALRRAMPDFSAAPATWTFAEAELVNTAFASVRMRAAA